MMERFFKSKTIILKVINIVAQGSLAVAVKKYHLSNSSSENSAPSVPAPMNSKPKNLR